MSFQSFSSKTLRSCGSMGRTGFSIARYLTQWLTHVSEEEDTCHMRRRFSIARYLTQRLTHVSEEEDTCHMRRRFSIARYLTQWLTHVSEEEDTCHMRRRFSIARYLTQRQKDVNPLSVSLSLACSLSLYVPRDKLGLTDIRMTMYTWVAWTPTWHKDRKASSLQREHPSNDVRGADITKSAPLDCGH